MAESDCRLFRTAALNILIVARLYSSDGALGEASRSWFTNCNQPFFFTELARGTNPSLPKGRLHVSRLN